MKQIQILAIVTAGLCLAAEPIAEITVPGKQTFPESATSTVDGTIFVGSLTQQVIYKVAPGSATAKPWIKTGANGLQAVLGVLADEKSGTLWACSTNLSGHGEQTALKSFDLATGASRASYPFPGGRSVCNDIAIGPDGTAYVTDTVNPRILRLRPGRAALDVWTSDPRFDSLDGIAFGTNTTIYVNTVQSGHLFRIPVEFDGTAGKPVQLELSASLDRPDGMRADGRNQLLLVEGAGHLDRVTFVGNQARIEVLKAGFNGSTARHQSG